MNFKNERILITGAAGSIGSALANRIASLKPKQLVLLDNNESGLFEIYESVKNSYDINVDYIIRDIRDERGVLESFYKYKPDIVYHAAAYKHVVLMEKYPKEALKTNVHGLVNVLCAAKVNGAKKFVFISTDKAVNPTSVMGKTKKKGEELCRLDKIFGNKMKRIIVRFGNVMASRGSVIPIWQKAIEENKDLIVTDKKMKRYFMGIYDAVELILEATKLGKGGEIFVLDMGDQMSIYMLAELMVKLSGKDLKIKLTKQSKGEKYTESLMTKEEAKRSVKKGKLYIIKNNV